MKQSILVVCAFVALQAAIQTRPACAQTPPASPQQLAAITQRGRALEAYDQAAWHGTDAAKAIAGGDTTGLRYYIARRTSTGWLVDFGTLDAAGTTFSTTLEAVSADGQHFTAQRLSPSRSDTGFLVAAAHAIQTAEAAFKFVSGFHYNVAVIPNPDGTMYVYLYPAQTDPTIFPLGGDGRFTISADGTKILDAHRMHNAVMTPSADSVPSNSRMVAGFHNDVVENVPQDTDVFHVLARKPPLPEFVNAQGQFYLINVDGSIEYKGTTPPKP